MFSGIVISTIIFSSAPFLTPDFIENKWELKLPKFVIEVGCDIVPFNKKRLRGIVEAKKLEFGYSFKLISISWEDDKFQYVCRNEPSSSYEKIKHVPIEYECHDCKNINDVKKLAQFGFPITIIETKR